jgi:hypothetical protein
LNAPRRSSPPSRKLFITVVSPNDVPAAAADEEPVFAAGAMKPAANHLPLREALGVGWHRLFGVLRDDIGRVVEMAESAAHEQTA